MSIIRIGNFLTSLIIDIYQLSNLYTGQPGRPSYHIDSDFLQWAYATCSISSISRFLGISRGSVRNALLAYGMAEPQISPFQTGMVEEEAGTPLAEHDFLLDPDLPMPAVSEPQAATQRITSLLVHSQSLVMLNWIL
jgi:hypothetical protein